MAIKLLLMQHLIISLQYISTFYLDVAGLPAIAISVMVLDHSDRSGKDKSSLTYAGNTGRRMLDDDQTNWEGGSMRIGRR